MAYEEAEMADEEAKMPYREALPNLRQLGLFASSGWTIINAALFTIVAAEVVRNGVLVLSNRRQA